MEMAITAWLGVDIAKQKFDVALNWKTRRRAKVFRNDAEGWQALLRWLKDLGVDQVPACLEATGRYGDGLALHLHDAGHRVSIVNPAQIKHFGRAKVRGAKPRATIYALFRAVLAKVLTSNPKALMASDKQCRVKLLCIIGWILNISATGI